MKNPPSAKLDELVAQREELRTQINILKSKVGELTSIIKIERVAVRNALRTKQFAQTEKSSAFENMVLENAELRRLLAVSLKDDTKTYKWVGEKMGVSPSRVAEMVSRQARTLRSHTHVNLRKEYQEEK